MAAKVINFFNHKGGIGKTTLVHNLAFALADENQKILLIDADPQMNLTAAMYGLSTTIDYSMDDGSKWVKNTEKYLSFFEHLDSHLNDKEIIKKSIYASSLNKIGKVDLISGSIKLAAMEADLFEVIKSNNTFTQKIPYRFQQAIKKYTNEYDFILIDTSPSASSIINALIMMSSNYFISPVSPSFFSLQAIDNLSEIFRNWVNLLSPFMSTREFKGLDFNVKFTGLVVQLAKRYKQYSASTEEWIKDLNESVKTFQQYAISIGKSISKEDFAAIFEDRIPFIIEKCCDFTPQLRGIAEKEGIPVIYLTQEICNKHNKRVNIDSKKDSQYAKSFKSINDSYRFIKKV